jgi:Origin recognition complex (ORC) subunit 4 C-terminus
MHVATQAPVGGHFQPLIGSVRPIRRPFGQRHAVRCAPSAVMHSRLTASVGPLVLICCCAWLLHLQPLLVASCSVLELFMLVGALRLVSRGREVINFEMVFEEYRLLNQALANAHADVFGRKLSIRAFEKLIRCGLLVFADPRHEPLADWDLGIADLH